MYEHTKVSKYVSVETVCVTALILTLSLAHAMYRCLHLMMDILPSPLWRTEVFRCLLIPFLSSYRINCTQPHVERSQKRSDSKAFEFHLYTVNQNDWTNGRLTSSLPVTYDGDFSFEKCGANATAYKDDKVTQSTTPVCASKQPG